MHYKTVILELLKQRPTIHHQLRRKRTLLQTVDRYARKLRANHETWKERLSQAKPDSHPTQIASEALEIALKELEDCLLSGVSPNPNEPPSLEGAMTFIRSHKPSG